MPKFVTIGYGNEAGYRRIDEAVRADAHAHDAKLQKQGVEIGIAGKAVQVRNHAAKEVSVLEGAFMRSEMPVAGFAVLEAADLREAIEMVSKTPCAVAYGVVEVWPLHQVE